MTINGVEKKYQPQLVKLDRSLKLAEQWVSNMSGSSVSEKSAVVELEERPARLGIGATVPRESKVALPYDPVERKLLDELNAKKRKVIYRAEELGPSAKNSDLDDECEEDESESKTKAFGKRRPMRLVNITFYGKKNVRKMSQKVKPKHLAREDP